MSSSNGNAGNVTITASGAVIVDHASSRNNEEGATINTKLSENAQGRAGDITITAASIEFINNTQLEPASEGIGDGGLITLKANEVTFNDSLVTSDSTRFCYGQCRKRLT